MATKNSSTDKKGATKSKTRKNKSQAVRVPKISWIVKPDNMTLEEWQRALRKQTNIIVLILNISQKMLNFARKIDSYGKEK